jgi:LPS sulfotransferase NodH
VSASASPIGRRLYWERLAAIQQQIAARLMVGPEANPFRSLDRRFIVAHSPRVGSHLLCAGLLGYGAVVEEFFEVARIHNVSSRKGFSSLRQYCEWVVADYGIGGVFGVSGGVKALAPLVMTGEIPAFVSDWRFVHLTRRDIVRQAVSELVAKRTGAYKSSRTPTTVLTVEDYDAQRLKRLIDAAMTVNAAWQGAFEVYGVEPLRLTYETLAADPAAVTAQAAAFLGLDRSPVTDARSLAPPMKRQATSLNEAWASRFRAENLGFCEAREAGDFQPQGIRLVKA